MKSFEKFSSSIFRNLFMEICPLKICLGDFSLFHEDVSMEICPLKICLGDFSFENFLQEKQELTSSQFACITHELPLFDLCI